MELIEWLHSSVADWNAWRRENPHVAIDLSGAYLRDTNLRDANLSGANLSGADLTGAYLSGANLSGANLTGAYLSGANLSGANLTGANLRDAYLRDAYLCDAYLSGAYLNWTQPELIAEILRQAATTRDQTAYAMTVAGARLTGWCWAEFLEYLADKPELKEWSVNLLKQWSNDDAPKCIKEG